MRLKPGLYEQIINSSISNELKEIPAQQKAIREIDKAEASKILSAYLQEVIQKGLDNIGDESADASQAISAKIELTNQIVNLIQQKTNEGSFSELSVDCKAQQLLALLQDKDPMLAVGKNANNLDRPETSIAQSSLFTGAIHEPQMFSELKKEIASADRIDMLVSFIKWSGLRLLIDELKTFTYNGKELRIITTSYMGATDLKAIEELRKLPNTKIKVSYDTKRTRLHAKTYVFYRDTGFTTAYVGSSNLSNVAISSGLEWNVKVTKKDLPETIDKIAATFESYWNSNDFEYYREDQKERLSRALNAEKYIEHKDSAIFITDVTPYSYQQEILDKLQAERAVQGHYRNLIVAATGTGKTVISALDYKRYCKNNSDKPCRLLFVAHREEILKQSLFTFRAVLKDANFGELFVGNHRPTEIKNLFMSIQTFQSQEFTTKTAENYYDFIIVDEFHHAAAPSYEKLLNYYHPQILLGLTATPERMDGKSILPYFDNRIAAEIRLPEAIERKLLCPFQYFGVSDNVDLRGLSWARGGYDKTELSNIYSFSGAIAEERANLIIAAIIKYVTDINEVKGLGFCVSVEHAKFMAIYFNEHGIPSISLTGQSNNEERDNAKNKLISGAIRFIFVVDIYNEGVDIPEINTVLFLRPTESLTIFLQQLGRGLRLAENKECLTVLDFIGQANKKYRFEEKFAALLSNTRHSVKRELEDGFISLPKGCYIQLEKMASEYILDNISSSFDNSNGIVSALKSFKEDSGLEPTLNNFLEYNHLDPRFLYKNSLSFTRLCSRAGIQPELEEPLEVTISKACAKFAVTNSRRWIKFLLNIISELQPSGGSILKLKARIHTFTENEKLMLNMFCSTIWGQFSENWDDNRRLENLFALSQNSRMLQELSDLLHYQFKQIDFIDTPVELGFACPLDLHCNYSRDQLLTALGYSKPSTIREGVKWLEDKKIDIFMITLNKSDKDYSPTTMYNDYSINESLFHWQSQSTTSASSPTGQRYINHKRLSTRILLFVREFKTDSINNAAEAYTFLGPATYVRHEGSRPMNITWKLDFPIPAKFLKKTSKLLVG